MTDDVADASHPDEREDDGVIEAERVTRSRTDDPGRVRACRCVSGDADVNGDCTRLCAITWVYAAEGCDGCRYKPYQVAAILLKEPKRCTYVA